LCVPIALQEVSGERLQPSLPFHEFCATTTFLPSLSLKPSKSDEDEGLQEQEHARMQPTELCLLYETFRTVYTRLAWKQVLMTKHREAKILRWSWSSACLTTLSPVTLHTVRPCNRIAANPGRGTSGAYK